MFSPIPEILEDVRAGKFVILCDAEDRENEGDLILAAQHATPEKVNQILRLAGGYLCLSLTSKDCDRLHLHPQSPHNSSVRGTPFTVSIDGHPRHGVGTGVSAQDRAKTIQMAIDPATGPDDFVRPGHINPLRAREGGVLVRIGQTEGGIDLARLAGLHPSALVIEIVRADGHMARRDDLVQMCAEHGLKMCSIDQLIEHRLKRERLVRRIDPVEGATVETDLGPFTLYAYESVVDPLPHLALTVGGVGALDASGRAQERDEPVLVRMHRRNLLGDIFGDLKSSPEGPTREALREAMRAIQRAGKGAIVYLRPQGQGDAFDQRLIRHAGVTDLGPENTPKVPMDLREFGIGGQILRDLGLRRLRLLTNHPKSLPGIDAFGLEITEHVPLEAGAG